MHIIEYKGERVLTSAMLGDSYETDSRTISKNYTRNKKRYQEGKHFFVLTGEELREFKTNHQIDDQLKHSPSLYLWTVKGAFHHAKSLGTDKAWEAYELLVDDYFKKAELLSQAAPVQIVERPSSVEDLIIMQAQSVKELKEQFAEFKAVQARESEERTKELECVKEAVDDIANKLTEIPSGAVVTRKVNELKRWCRLPHEEVYNRCYDLLKAKHGVDVKRRMDNERERIQKDYFEKTGKKYSESTLKSKVSGVDIMVRMGCLSQFYDIVVGWIAREKTRNQLRVVQ